jgi:ribosomal protein L40E
LSKKCPLCGTVYESFSQKYCLEKHCPECGFTDFAELFDARTWAGLIMGFAGFSICLCVLLLPKEPIYLNSGVLLFGCVFCALVALLSPVFLHSWRCLDCKAVFKTPKTHIELISAKPTQIKTSKPMQRKKPAITKCRKCGAIMPGRAKFCGKCGAVLSKSL